MDDNIINRETYNKLLEIAHKQPVQLDAVKIKYGYRYVLTAGEYQGGSMNICGAIKELHDAINAPAVKPEIVVDGHIYVLKAAS